jgi:hypothetical protein
MFDVRERIAIRDSQETLRGRENEGVVCRQLVFAENGAGQFRGSVTRGVLPAPLYTFVPVAVETFGVFGRAAKSLFAAIGRRLAKTSCDPRGGIIFRQRISLDIQRGNAEAVRGKRPQAHQSVWW